MSPRLGAYLRRQVASVLPGLFALDGVDVVDLVKTPVTRRLQVEKVFLRRLLIDSRVSQTAADIHHLTGAGLLADRVWRLTRVAHPVQTVLPDAGPIRNRDLVVQRRVFAESGGAYVGGRAKRSLAFAGSPKPQLGSEKCRGAHDSEWAGHTGTTLGQWSRPTSSIRCGGRVMGLRTMRTTTGGATWGSARIRSSINRP
jgi:hypothetical protein